MPAVAAVDVVLLHADDNIAVAARLLEPGEKIEVGGRVVAVAEPIRMGHKVAVAPIALGGRVLKYGQQIGVTTEPVEPGQWVHCHNLVNGAGERDFAPCRETPPDPEPIVGRTFDGYRRASGKAGTRNYLAVISTVNCSASVAKLVSRRFDESLLRDYPNVDGILPITHGSGCGMQYRGSAHEMLNRTLAGIARHPNIGGYLLIGLGCEQGWCKSKAAMSSDKVRRCYPSKISAARPRRWKKASGSLPGFCRKRTTCAARQYPPARSCWRPSAAVRMATRA
jgi:altronate hydrolase